MGTSCYGCSCYITKSMFGEREVMSVGHYPDHFNLFSQEKTLRQMADEIIIGCTSRESNDL